MFKKLLLTTAVFGIVGLGTQAIAHDHADHSSEKATMEHAGEKHMDEAKAAMDQDIVATAMANEDFSTLVAAVKAAGLVETLQGEGPFTVFAPTNAAFEALPEGTLEDLLKPENKEKLASILKYHVVPTSIMADDIKDGVTEVTTAEGQNLEVKKTDAGVMVDGANVTATDIKTSNGVIHVIDAVVLPDNNS